MPNSLKRVITASLLLGIFVAIVYAHLPKIVYVLLGLVVTIVCVFESFGMAQETKIKALLGSLFTLLVCVYIHAYLTLDMVYFLIGVQFLLYLTMIYLMVVLKPNGMSPHPGFVLTLTLPTICSAWGLYLHILTIFPIKALFLIATAWVGDSSAYLFGDKRPIGLWISPNKSWRGYCVGAVVMFAWLMIVGIYFDIHSILYIIWSVIAVMLIFLGDLWMSLIKRVMQVKDSGFILPGHGGVLDRFDSQLWFAGWLAVLVINLM